MTDRFAKIRARVLRRPVSKSASYGVTVQCEQRHPQVSEPLRWRVIFENQEKAQVFIDKVNSGQMLNPSGSPWPENVHASLINGDSDESDE